MFEVSLRTLILTVQAGSSRAEVNSCHQCSRHPDTCRRISGLFTVTVLSEGTYNPVVEIPAPACSVNISEFKESSNYIALKTKRDEGIINSYWGLSPPGQYSGAGTVFTYDRGSSNCKGNCIYGDGPTNDGLVVQVLYYDKNPGIAYTFILPNNVPFTPFEGAATYKQAPSGQLQPDPNSFYRHNSSLLQHQGRHRLRQQHSNLTDASRVFEGEYYTGHHSSRSEGRPDITSALSSHSKVPSRQNSFNYTNARYGTHTLGGRGMSYTVGGETQPLPGRHIIERVQSPPLAHTRPGHPNIRKLPSPEYIAHPRQHQNAPSLSGEPLYQTYSISGQNLESRDAEHFERSSSSNEINTSQSLGQVRGHGSNLYRWKISGFTDCTHTCGGGAQRPNIVCVSVSSRTQVVVTPENCLEHLKPKIQTVQCNTQPCEPAWEAKEWSECSVTCGSGTQTRIVECQQRFSAFLTLKVSADQCGLGTKPAVSQQCETDFCSQWKTGPWSECTKVCGGGDRTRSVQCVDKLENEIPASHCTEAAPKYFERCNTQPCSSAAQWWLTDWSGECSDTCETDRRVRSAICLNKRGSIVPSSTCNKPDLPIMEESCPLNKYCQGTWFVGQWSKCSAECGSGKMVRQVVCIQNLQSSMNIVKNEECNLRHKPKTEEPCVNTNCNAKWYASPWSECSATCGEAYRTREVRCVEDNKRVSDSCDPLLRPAVQETCSAPVCSQPKDISPKSLRPGITNSTRETPQHGERKIEDSLLEDDRRVRYRGQAQNLNKPFPIRKHDKSCKDNFQNCLMVTQARLCSYSYYRKLCCESCQKV
ncbi:ADAMTS-like protein 4 isoform X2 [Biomphalaria glabrata]|uniref:ADAMTS-like protein 4 isoform X2 n=1 Tax=Biomphalaria glabrata TaxID=6526 RepID=A0A9W3AEZ5_BIOGL|nr:ADAMTS-like protein 4 isoform X2 [Biomphalaria glabrata]